IGAIQLAQEPDGILALAGQQKLAKKREKERLARIAAAEAALHEGEVPAHEVVRTESPTSVPTARAVAAVPSGAMAFRGIIAGYGDVEVLHGVDLTLEAGAVVALLGANGAGKSTLCSVAAGLVTSSIGTVWLAGRDVTAVPSFQRARDGVMVVPEARGIFPGLTVEENLAISLREPSRRQKAYERF